MFYAALFYMPFAEVIAIGFISPFFVTLLAALILKEAVGRGRWLAWIQDHGTVRVAIMCQSRVGGVME